MFPSKNSDFLRKYEAVLSGKKTMNGWTAHCVSRTRIAFTLIELLVVIAIISLLVSILLPSLNRAKDLAKRTVCGTNIHANILGCMMYAEENNGILPALGNFSNGADGASANLYYWGNTARIPPGKNLNEILQPYTEGMLTWADPATGGPPPDHVDSDGPNARNSRSSSYFSYHYLPARAYPNFGEDADAGEFVVPSELAEAKSGQVLMQDPVRYYVSSDYGWNANHGTGGYEFRYDGNPSSATFFDRSENGELGGNIGLYDGSVNWYVLDKLTNIGQDKRTKTGTKTADFYSILP